MLPKQKRRFAESESGMNTDDMAATCNMFALPPSDHRFDDGESHLYPPCFEENPFMPSCIYMDDQQVLATLKEEKFSTREVLSERNQNEI